MTMMTSIITSISVYGGWSTHHVEFYSQLSNIYSGWIYLRMESFIYWFFYDKQDTTYLVSFCMDLKCMYHNGKWSKISQYLWKTQSKYIKFSVWKFVLEFLLNYRIKNMSKKCVKERHKVYYFVHIHLRNCFKFTK